VVIISKTTLKKFAPQGTTPLGFSFFGFKPTKDLIYFQNYATIYLTSTGQVEQRWKQIHY
jgi:hypothetical protein